MAENTGEEKTLPASTQKKQRAREEGNIGKSQDLSASMALLVALGALFFLAGDMLRRLVLMGNHFLGNAHLLTIEHVPLQTLALRVALELAFIMLPFMLVMLTTGLALNFIQVGFLLTPKPLQPKFSRLNPISGFKKFTSLRTLVELFKSLGKLGIVVGILWLTMGGMVNDFLVLMATSPWSLLKPVAELIAAVWWRIALAMFILGLLDFAYQRWQRDRDLRMTQQEAKEESKQLEGDPKVKRRIRQLQREMAMRRMMGEVPRADVVITNPIHYAVALRYDLDTMAAPVVVAKGQRLLAQRIRELAQANDVPIVHRPELARLLFRTVEVEEPIPEDLFRAVAEVLSFVYQIDRRAQKKHERAAKFGARVAV